MAELASLQIKVVRDGIEQAQKALNDLAKAANAAEKGADGAGKGFDGANAKTKTFASEISGLAKFMTAGAIAAGLYNIGKAALQASAEMEQNKIAFTTMLGSAEAATALLKDMTSFAASTPFQLPEIVNAGKQMLAFGFAAQDVIPTLKKLGDISAGLSIPVGELASIYGKMKTSGLIQAEELNQLAGRGIPIFSELAKVMGVNASQVKQLGSEGKITFTELEKAFTNMTKEGSQFGGLMDAQSQSMAGQWSNLQDALTKISTLLGDEMSGSAKSLTALLTVLIAKFSEGGPEKKEGIGLWSYLLDAATNSMNGLNDKVALVGENMGSRSKELEDYIFNMERSGGGVSENMQSILDKYGKLNGSAAILASYQRGGLELTSKQVAEIKKMFDAENELLKQRQYSNATLSGSLDLMKEWGNLPTVQGTGVIKPFSMTDNPNLPINGETPKPKTKGTGESQLSKDMKYLNDILKSGYSDMENATKKYQEQMGKVEDVLSKVKAGTSEYATAKAAAAVAEEQWNEAYENSNTIGMKYAKTLGMNKKETIATAAAIDTLLLSMATSPVNIMAQSFEKMGEAMGKGESLAKSLKNALGDMALEIASMIPMLFVSAGLQMIIASGGTAIGPGLGLIALGMAGQIGVGYTKGRIAKREEEKKAEALATQAQAAHGAVFGFARGGSFTNEIINSPTRFAFANGGGMSRGIMGEAGTEAVVPLKRMSNGNLGVESGGGNEVNVTIINGSGEPVNVKKETSSSGQDIVVTIGAVVSKQLADGTFDKTFKARYGLTQKGI